MPDDESARLEELRSLNILDTPFEERFDRITRLAARLFQVPIALVSLVDANRQWFKSCQGLSARETSRDVSFCGHAILSQQALVIEDAHLDPRFCDNPLVTGEPRIRFYAGHPLVGPRGHRLGTLCILDRSPRRLGSRDLETLRDLAALAESELNATQLTGLFESLADGIIVFDELGVIESVNPAAQKLFGRGADECVGRPVEEILPGVCQNSRGGQPCDHPAGLSVAAGGAGQEGVGRRADGTQFPAELTVGEMRQAGRMRFVGIVHDLTGRKRIEERMHLQVAALEATANGIVITDRAGTIQWVNPAFSRLTCYSSEEVVGRSTRLLKSGAQDPSYYRDLWHTITSGRVWHGELINCRKDGSQYTEEMTITPVRDAQGEICHFVAVKQDVTARRLADKKLRETMAQLAIQYREADRARSETRSILDATGEAMVLVAPDDRFLEVNRRFEEVFGAGAEEVLKRRFSDLLPLVRRIFEDPEGLIARLAHTAEDTERRLTEVFVQRWPRKRELALYSTPVRNATGESMGRLYAFRDVTRERELDRMKSEFVSLVSHELRTPLTSMGGFVEMLLDGDAGDLSEEQREYLEVVEKNTRRLTALIDDLLDVSRIEAGRIELRLLPHDLNELIQGVVECLRPQIEAENQRLTVSVDDGLHAVVCDADRVTQILTNLLSNAHKYTAAGGDIQLTAIREGDRARVVVRDTGIGLTSEEQGKLFTKFFRADNPTTQKVGGTGLGLWITRSLVEMHGGEITASSSPDQGSTFAFTLPIRREAPTPHPRQRGE